MNAHLTVTHCLSTSPTFLVATPSFFQSSDPGGAMLTNVVHRPRPSKVPSPAKVLGGAWSIYWGSYRARSLILQGCELGSPVRCDAFLESGVVVDLGSSDHGNLEVLGTGQAVVSMTTPRT